MAASRVRALGALLGAWAIALAAMPVYAITAGGLLAAEGTIAGVDTLHSGFTLTPPGPGGPATPLQFAVDVDTVIVKNGETWPWSQMLAGSDPVSVRYVMDGTRRLVRWMHVGLWAGARLTGTVAELSLVERRVTVQPQVMASTDSAAPPLSLAVTEATLIIEAGRPQPLYRLQRGQLVTAEFTPEAGQQVARIIEIHPPVVGAQ